MFFLIWTVSSNQLPLLWHPYNQITVLCNTLILALAVLTISPSVTCFTAGLFAVPLTSQAILSRCCSHPRKPNHRDSLSLSSSDAVLSCSYLSELVWCVSREMLHLMWWVHHFLTVTVSVLKVNFDKVVANSSRALNCIHLKFSLVCQLPWHGSSSGDNIV